MLVLASGSERRRRLLEDAGLPFVVRVAGIDEHDPERGEPHAVALANARRKVAAVEGDTVLGADTVVAVGRQLLGKPRDDDHARAMLRRLSGSVHSVVTAVVLRHHGRLFERTTETRVTMRAWTDAEIEAYVASGEGRGKAGSYAIQESADRFVTALDGPRDNVVGLPVNTVRELIEESGAIV